MGIWSILVGLFLIVGAVAPVQAQVVSGDDPVFGPGSIAIDLSTGYEWLAPHLSANRSIADVSSQFGIGGDFEGFRYATQDEVIALWQSAGLSIGFDFPTAPYEAFLSVMGGPTETGGPYGTSGRIVSYVSTEAAPGFFYAPDVGIFSGLGFANPNNCCATPTETHPQSGSWLVRVPAPSRTLSALGPAMVWLGLKNSDAVGLRLDVKVELFVNTTANAPIGAGQLANVSSGSSGFNKAILNAVPLDLADGPVELASGDQLLLTVSVRRTCSGGGHNTGTPWLWYDGAPVDDEPGRDAGTRIDATIDSNASTYYLRTGFTLSTTAGASRTSIDKSVNSSAACPGRPFTPFGTWTVTP